MLGGWKGGSLTLLKHYAEPCLHWELRVPMFSLRPTNHIPLPVFPCSQGSRTLRLLL